jgi:hypothetical protein
MVRPCDTEAHLAEDLTIHQSSRQPPTFPGVGPQVPPNRNQGSPDRRISSYIRDFVQSTPGTSAFRTSFGAIPNRRSRT